MKSTLNLICFCIAFGWSAAQGQLRFSDPEISISHDMFGLGVRDEVSRYVVSDGWQESENAVGAVYQEFSEQLVNYGSDYSSIYSHVVSMVQWSVTPGTGFSTLFLGGSRLSSALGHHRFSSWVSSDHIVEWSVEMEASESFLIYTEAWRDFKITDLETGSSLALNAFRTYDNVDYFYVSAGFYEVSYRKREAYRFQDTSFDSFSLSLDIHFLAIIPEPSAQAYSIGLLCLLGFVVARRRRTS